MRQELAMMPRQVTSRLEPSEPEKPNTTSVAAPMTNQVLTSWLLTTSPRLTASSSFRWVGSSERSPLSSCSATTARFRSSPYLAAPPRELRKRRALANLELDSAAYRFE